MPADKSKKRKAHKVKRPCKYTHDTIHAGKKTFREAFGSLADTGRDMSDAHDVVITSILHKCPQLAVGTAGIEDSCSCCALPFGVVLQMTGMVVTAVAFSFNSHGFTIFFMGLVLLSSSFLQCGKLQMHSPSQTTLMLNCIV
uniref:Uncharacterized protein n=1 Tax=Electrophorus electricus TaxID=8005 RepID=A0AAY5EY68_ELEEL